MPSLSVHHVDAIWLPDDHDGVLAWVEARNELHSSDTQGVNAIPRSLTLLLSLAIDQSQLASIILKGNDTIAITKQVVNDFSLEVALSRKLHLKVSLADLENCNTIVCAQNKVIIRFVIIWHHNHLVDHTQLIEKSTGQRLGLILNL